MTRKNLMIFSVSAGAGHVRAAEALRDWANVAYPDLDVIHVDVMELVPDLFRKFYSESYLSLVEHQPSVWGYLYKAADKKKADSKTNKLKLAIERLNTQKFKDWIKVMKPDYIICTHFLPAELLSRMIRKHTFDKPVWVVVTDYDIHSFWVHGLMTGYFVATDEVGFRLTQRGVEPKKIKVTGIPVAPEFSRNTQRKWCAGALGIDPAKFTVVVMSGGLGLGGNEGLVERIARIDKGLQVLAMSGRNKQLLDSYKEIGKRYPGQVFPQGFVKDMEVVLGACDIAITKPGGLTSSECLAKGLPMILVSPIPGQEERNSDFLIEHGAALKAVDPLGLEYRVRSLLKDPKELKRLKAMAVSAGRPMAAKDILRTVLEYRPPA
jgi:processive 1,2-diacylglycerol beta-glucosyltransferase